MTDAPEMEERVIDRIEKEAKALASGFREQFDRIGKRLDGIGKRLDGIGKRLDELTAEVSLQRAALERSDSRGPRRRRPKPFGRSGRPQNADGMSKVRRPPRPSRPATTAARTPCSAGALVELESEAREGRLYAMLVNP